MRSILLKIPEICNSDRALVLATVIATRGSTPQKPGSTALFDAHGLIAGTIGGGVVEGRTSEMAVECSKSGKSILYTFNLENDISDKYEAICGGEITILIDGTVCNNIDVFTEIRKSYTDRIPGIIVSLVNKENNDIVIVERHWITSEKSGFLPRKISERILPEVTGILSSASPGFRQTEISMPGEKPVIVLLEPVFPPKELVIGGAGHIGKALSHLGRMLDFAVTVIDDRVEYANKKNLPDADNIIVDDIGRAIRKIKKGKDTYIVIVTRGHKDDAEALRPCIGSGAAYVGMIGSRIKVAQMKEEFIRNKWADEEQWKKIYAPIGLEIKSGSVEEIAVSIAAQIILVRNSTK